MNRTMPSICIFTHVGSPVDGNHIEPVFDKTKPTLRLASRHCIGFRDTDRSIAQIQDRHDPPGIFSIDSSIDRLKIEIPGQRNQDAVNSQVECKKTPCLLASANRMPGKWIVMSPASAIQS